MESIWALTRYILCVLLAAGALGFGGSRPLSAAEKPPIDYLPALKSSRDALIAMMRKEGVEGVSVAVTDENGLLWLDGFGYADKERNIYASGETVYGAGALSMLVTALAVLRATDDHQLALDEPVAHYLPEFTMRHRHPSDKPLTLRHILAQHSGLPYAIYKGMWAVQPESLETAVAKLGEEYVAYPPETLMTISIAAYDVAGRVLENKFAQDFAQAAYTKVLQPLAMLDSAFRLNPALQAKLAKGYKNGKVQPTWQARDAPAMGLYSSAKDIAALLRMALNEGRSGGKDLWSAHAINEFLRPQFAHTALDLGAQYGLGWTLGDNDLNGTGRVAWRSGATLTHRARAILLPDARLGIVIFANSAKGYKLTEQIGTQVARAFAERKLGRAMAPSAAAVAPLAVPVNALNARTGAYATRVGYVMLKADKDRLLGDVMGWNVQLQPRADGWFYPRLKLFGVVPIDLELMEAVKLSWQRVGEREIIVSQYKGQNSVFAEHLPMQPLTPAWAARLGKYVIDNADDISEFMEVRGGELRFDQGALYLAYKLPLWVPVTMRVPLSIVNDKEALIPGLGTGLGEVVRVIDTPRGERLVYGGYTIRRQP